MKRINYILNMLCAIILICTHLPLKAQTLSPPQIDTPLTVPQYYFYNAPLTVPYSNGEVGIFNNAAVEIHSTSEVTLLPGFIASTDSGCGEFVAGIRDCPVMTTNPTSSNVTCYGRSDGSIVTNVQGGKSPHFYNWFPYESASPVIKDISPGVYFLEVSDQSNCILTDSFSIAEPDTINITYNIISSTCNDSSGSITAEVSGGNGGFEYFWFPFGGNDSVAHDLTAGKYTINVVDSVGCANLVDVYVSDSDGPEVLVSSIDNVSCYGKSDGSAAVSVMPGYYPFSFYWLQLNLTDSIAEELRAGNYFVQVRDSNNCITIQQVIISEPSPISLAVSCSPSGCMNSTGQSIVLATGGIGNYSYNWSNGETDSVANNLPAGFDTVYVYDNNNCMSSAAFLIQSESSVSVNIQNISDLTCFGDSNGNAEVTVNGGTPPYTLSLLPNTEVGYLIENLSAGPYMLEVMDASGCKNWREFFINDPPHIDVTLFYVNPSTDSASDGEIISVVKGGVTPLSYNWQNSELNSYRLTNIDTGEYLLQVIDANGCTGEGRGFVYGQPNDCIKATPTGYCTPISVTPCAPLVLCYKDIVSDFGADPSGLTNSQCAFEAAAEFFNARGGYGTLNIPPGTYKVGVQFGKSQYPHLTFGKTGSDVLCLKDCKNLTIQGKIVGGIASKIVFDDCLEYGTFDPATGQRLILGSTDGLPYRYLTSPGSFLVALKCSNITIKNLDIDGNSDNLSYGGHHYDGIQIPADGIVFNSVRTARIENVNVHHFGRDGLAVYDNLINPAGLFNTQTNLTITHTKFNFNGRIGFYWGGGKNINVSHSEFNNNASARFGSKAADGIDYEYFGGIPMENGSFINCEFMHNAAYGIEVYATNSNHAVNQYFRECTFAAGENTFCASPNGKNFTFERCNFYGPINKAYH